MINGINLFTYKPARLSICNSRKLLTSISSCGIIEESNFTLRKSEYVYLHLQTCLFCLLALNLYIIKTLKHFKRIFNKTL